MKLAIDEQINLLPARLRSTGRLVSSAFPQGVPEEAYRPLLALLGESPSYRGLAEVMAYCTGKDYALVYNDVLAAGSPFGPGKPEPAAIERVRQRLAPFGYDEWLKEE